MTLLLLLFVTTTTIITSSSHVRGQHDIYDVFTENKPLPEFVPDSLTKYVIGIYTSHKHRNSITIDNENYNDVVSTSSGNDIRRNHSSARRMITNNTAKRMQNESFASAPDDVSFKIYSHLGKKLNCHYKKTKPKPINSDLRYKIKNIDSQLRFDKYDEMKIRHFLKTLRAKISKKCFTHDINHYRYDICPFKSVHQTDYRTNITYSLGTFHPTLIASRSGKTIELFDRRKHVYSQYFRDGDLQRRTRISYRCLGHDTFERIRTMRSTNNAAPSGASEKNTAGSSNSTGPSTNKEKTTSSHSINTGDTTTQTTMTISFENNVKTKIEHKTIDLSKPFETNSDRTKQDASSNQQNEEFFVTNIRESPKLSYLVEVETSYMCFDLERQTDFDFIERLAPLQSESCLVFTHNRSTEYKFCYGKSIERFDKQKILGVDSASVQINVLGKIEINQLEKQTQAWIIANRSDASFISQVYTNGDNCQGTDLPIETKVIFQCSNHEHDRFRPDSYIRLFRPSRIVHVEQISTCRYIVDVETNLLCRDRKFQPESTRYDKIVCSPDIE